MFHRSQWCEPNATATTVPPVIRYLCAAFIALGSSALMLAIVNSDKAAPDLAALVAANLINSGVQNPVTAVLLNFRSYDTLLEIAVLMIVAIAMLPDRTTVGQPLLTTDRTLMINPVLENLVRWLVPLAVLTSGYLLWIGANEPGGAFQAGAVLAASGIALSLAGHHHFTWSSTVARLVLTLGLLVFTIAAVTNIAITGTVLQYPLDAAGAIILLIETAATLSIATILLLLYTRLAEGHSPYLRKTLEKRF